jgi:hypothetical protein
MLLGRTSARSHRGIFASPSGLLAPSGNATRAELVLRSCNLAALLGAQLVMALSAANAALHMWHRGRIAGARYFLLPADARETTSVCFGEVEQAERQ